MVELCVVFPVRSPLFAPSHSRVNHLFLLRLNVLSILWVVLMLGRLHNFHLTLVTAQHYTWIQVMHLIMQLTDVMNPIIVIMN